MRAVGHKIRKILKDYKAGNINLNEAEQSILEIMDNYLEIDLYEELK